MRRGRALVEPDSLLLEVIQPRAERTDLDFQLFLLLPQYRSSRGQRERVGGDERRERERGPGRGGVTDCGVKGAVRPSEVEGEELAARRTHGIGDEDIWDIGAIAALFALSNRMANLMALRPNDEFYLMGRAPSNA